ncbi:MAG: hypothetical protein RM049_38235 [Nostoc sp. DedQUE04]|uniref:hypothetical protein n=1 Tax=Nostoc sp. DedQUE04 TaxID=3075390 RepID=UPI002AD22080|nr:hypothetical protein [Nostoc sp. DedQUE04]MDZ8141062.1 hypothetical protein [Nostoc sp. DedQUE04]
MPSLKQCIVHRFLNRFSLTGESPAGVGYCSGMLWEIRREDSVWKLCIEEVGYNSSVKGDRRHRLLIVTELLLCCI